MLPRPLRSEHPRSPGVCGSESPAPPALGSVDKFHIGNVDWGRIEARPFQGALRKVWDLGREERLRAPSSAAAGGSQLGPQAQQVKTFQGGFGATRISPGSRGIPTPPHPRQAPDGPHWLRNPFFLRLRVAFLSIATAIICFYNCKEGAGNTFPSREMGLVFFFLPPPPRVLLSVCISSLRLGGWQRNKPVLSINQAGPPV